MAVESRGMDFVNRTALVTCACLAYLCFPRIGESVFYSFVLWVLAIWAGFTLVGFFSGRRFWPVLFVFYFVLMAVVGLTLASFVIISNHEEMADFATAGAIALIGLLLFQLLVSVCIINFQMDYNTAAHQRTRQRARRLLGMEG